MSLDLWTASNLSRLSHIRHGFSRRTGGVSAVPFDTLNLGLHVGDDADAVRENRALVAVHFGLTLDRMVCAAQVHGGTVAVVGDAQAGLGANDFAGAIPSVDALVTSTPNLLLALFFADCVPVFFADTKRPVVAVAHAGWRGLVAGVLENTLATMHDRFGTEPSDVETAIGTCIGTAHFAVGAEVAAQFDRAEISWNAGKPHIDLKFAARRRLADAGIPWEQITANHECTASDSARYFSHRASGGRTGRMGAFISLCP